MTSVATREPAKGVRNTARPVARAWHLRRRDGADALPRSQANVSTRPWLVVPLLQQNGQYERLDPEELLLIDLTFDVLVGATTAVFDK